MTTHSSTTDRRRILVVANETTTSGTLDTLIGTQVENAADARVLVVAPILNSRFRHHDLVARARERFGLPVTHLIVDVQTGRERVPPSFVAGERAAA